MVAALSTSPEPWGHSLVFSVILVSHLQSRLVFVIILFTDCKIPTPHHTQKMRNAVRVRLEGILPLNIYFGKEKPPQLLKNNFTEQRGEHHCLGFPEKLLPQQAGLLEKRLFLCHRKKVSYSL